MMTEEQLLQEFLATKDRTILAALYERLRPRLYALAFRILKSRDDAEDIVENTFCKLYKLEKEPIRSAESFLFKITQNLALDSRLAKRRGIRRGMVSLTSMKLRSGALNATNSRERSADTIEEPIDKGPEIAEQQTMRQERIRELHEKTKPVFDLLPDDQKQAVDLYYARGMTIAETAKCLGINEDTAWSRIRRGMAAMRKKLSSEKKARISRPYPCPVLATAIETGLTVHEFSCIKDTVAAGFPVSSVRRALREGKVYQGLKWSYSNAV